MKEQLVMISFEGLCPSDLEIGQKAVLAYARQADKKAQYISREYALGNGVYSIQTSFKDGIRKLDAFTAKISHIYYKGIVLPLDLATFGEDKRFDTLKDLGAAFCVYVRKHDEELVIKY